MALVKSYHVVDPTHIQLTLKNDQAIQVLYSFAGNRDGMIMAPSLVRDGQRSPGRCGALHSSKSYTSGQEVVLEKNPDYYDKDVYKGLTASLQQGLDRAAVGDGAQSG